MTPDNATSSDRGIDVNQARDLQVFDLLKRDISHRTREGTTGISVIATFDDAPGVYAIHDVIFGCRGLQVTDENGRDEHVAFYQTIDEKHGGIHEVHTFHFDTRSEFVSLERAAVNATRWSSTAPNTGFMMERIDLLERTSSIEDIPGKQQ